VLQEVSALHLDSRPSTSQALDATREGRSPRRDGLAAAGEKLAEAIFGTTTTGKDLATSLSAQQSSGAHDTTDVAARLGLMPTAAAAARSMKFPSPPRADPAGNSVTLSSVPGTGSLQGHTPSGQQERRSLQLTLVVNKGKQMKKSETTTSRDIDTAGADQASLDAAIRSEQALSKTLDAASNAALAASAAEKTLHDFQNVAEFKVQDAVSKAVEIAWVKQQEALEEALAAQQAAETAEVNSKSGAEAAATARTDAETEAELAATERAQALAAAKTAATAQTGAEAAAIAAATEQATAGAAAKTAATAQAGAETAQANAEAAASKAAAEAQAQAVIAEAKAVMAEATARNATEAATNAEATATNADATATNADATVKTAAEAAEAAQAAADEAKAKAETAAATAEAAQAIAEALGANPGLKTEASLELSFSEDSSTGTAAAPAATPASATTPAPGPV